MLTNQIADLKYGRYYKNFAIYLKISRTSISWNMFTGAAVTISNSTQEDYWLLTWYNKTRYARSSYPKKERSAH